MHGSKLELENKKSHLSSDVQERGNHIIVSAAGGVLVGAIVASISLPSVLTGAVIGAISGAAIGFVFSNTQSTDEEVAREQDRAN